MLDKAEVIVEAGINAQKQFAQNVLKGLTEEEKYNKIVPEKRTNIRKQTFGILK